MSACNLVVQLDALEDSADSAECFTTWSPELLDPNDDRVLNEALRNAIYAYSARWLPLPDALHRTGGSRAGAMQQAQSFQDQLWQRAQKTISAAMCRPR